MEPTFSHGGGDLRAQIETFVQKKIEEVRNYLFDKIEDLTIDAASNWPIGPLRASNDYGANHSAFRFEVLDYSQGSYLAFSIENPADYSMYIHEPGNFSRLVWEREIAEPIEEARAEIEAAISDIISGEIDE